MANTTSKCSYCDKHIAESAYRYLPCPACKRPTGIKRPDNPYHDIPASHVFGITAATLATAVFLLFLAAGIISLF